MVEYSEQVLEETPERVARFLSGMAAVPVIRTTMEVSGGMTVGDVTEGAALLNAVLVAPKPPKPATDTPDAQEVREAMVAIDGWDEPNFAIAKAALDRYHPDVSEYIFHDLSAGRGAASVTAVATFLARVRKLEDGTDPDRAATVETDRQATELLARRKITPEVRQDLEAKVAKVLGPTPSIPPEDSSAAMAEARRTALIALKKWYDDWSTVARKNLNKRSHLIRIGLASRRRSTKAEGGGEPTGE